MGRRWLRDRGEALALEYLEERGYTLVERNHRTRHGELDLVMCDEETLWLPITSPGRSSKTCAPS